jgi:asparagine synthase (glutamine-hydrolysing)
MCGIAFSCDPAQTKDARAARIAVALHRMAHRGPDEAGEWHGATAAAGHRRLSVIDLASSQQPMRDPTGRWVLAYNGEIYNYRDLRSSLESRWAFVTSGDTEVLLAGLLIEGTTFLERAQGMWAFALWDEQKHELLLSRDRFGKKPLFFSARHQSFHCSSELAALDALDPVSWEEDLDSTADFLRYGFYLPGTTAYRDVFEVLPGHLATWNGSEVLQEPYWILPFTPFDGTRSEAVEALRTTFTEAVRLRLVADVEVGSFLSGGVDSSLVTALAARSVPAGKLKTFTIGFGDATFDERNFAHLVADRLDTDHFEEVLDGWDEGKLEELLGRHLGQPFADASVLPTSLVSEVAAKRVKVALSGDGGDELFSGYQRYQARVLFRWYSRLPKALRSVTARFVKSLPEPLAHHSRSLLKKAHLFVDAADRSESERTYVAPLFHSKRELARLAPELSDRGHVPPGLPESAALDDVHRMMAMDALVYLPQDILVKVDRASMACSLETRAPFLDSRLAELAFSLPRRWHRRGMRGKRLLQEAFSTELPKSIWKRRKQGFGVPVGSWFHGSLGNSLLDMTRDGQAPLCSASVQALLDQHRSGRRDNGLRLWSLYTYLLWRRSGGRPHNGEGARC